MKILQISNQIYLCFEKNVFKNEYVLTKSFVYKYKNTLCFFNEYVLRNNCCLVYCNTMFIDYFCFKKPVCLKYKKVLYENITNFT